MSVLALDANVRKAVPFFWVRDIQESLRFYVDGLRFTATQQWVESGRLPLGEAAELVRPLLPLRSNSVVYTPARAPRVLTIRATPAQLQDVKSVLAKYEGAGSPACATRPAAAATP